MDLDESDLLEDGNSGGGKASSVSCSICLDVVSYNGERSRSRLQCGHEFHLDCIGSAFNMKGAMQCPNCRNFEKGQWRYSSGCCPFYGFNMDEWDHDENLFDLGYSEMSLGVHWCPFSVLARLSPSFDEGEFSSTAYHEFQHAIFAEHTTVVSSSHHSPYFAYFGPVHPSPSNSSGTVSDSSSVNHHWNGLSVPSEVLTSYAFPAMDVQYHSWEHHSPAFPTTSSMAAANQPSIPPVSRRAARANSDIPRAGSFIRPFFGGHSSAYAARSASSVAASIIPPHPGSVARAYDRVQALQAYFQQTSNSTATRTPVISVTRRSRSHGGLAQVGPMPSSSDQTSGYFVFPSGSSGGNFQEAENRVPSRFHAWEREHLPSFPLSQVNRDQGWGSFHHGAGVSESGIRPCSSLRQRRQGSGRIPSQNR